jgi:hypothetical protein
MPIAAPKIRPLTAWSFSRYSDFKTCKALFMYKHLMGMKEPGNDAMQRGTDIHKMGEQFLKGITPKLPAELSLFPDEFKQVKKEKVKSVEDTWVWTQDWKQETVFNDWAGAWVRIKIDVCYINVKENVSVPIDLKTGKIRDERQAEYMEQLELYALGALLKYPDTKGTSPRLWYLDAGVIYPDGSDNQPELFYAQSEVPALKKKWAARIKPMFTAKGFPPEPSHSCTWCHFRKSNGGPCKY